LDGKGFSINPPKKEDKTAIVGFVKLPKGHKDNPDAAARMGFQSLYLLSDGNTSVYTIDFDDSSPKLSLENYIRERQQRFNDAYPDGYFYPVELAPVVTEHLTKKNDVKCSAVLFNAAATGVNLYEEPMGKLVLFMKTPGGFWNIAWHTSINNLLDNKKNLAFTETLKDLRVYWRAEEGLEKDSVDSAPKVTTVGKQSKLG
jgi:hypothetical protein